MVTTKRADDALAETLRVSIARITLHPQAPRSAYDEALATRVHAVADLPGPVVANRGARFFRGADAPRPQRREAPRRRNRQRGPCSKRPPRSMFAACHACLRWCNCAPTLVLGR